MSKYLALQIYKGKLNYNDVVVKYPELKDAIDLELANLQEE